MDPRTLSRALLTAALLAAAAIPAFGQEKSPAKADCQEVVTPSGLTYCDLKVGQGEEATLGKVLWVHYIGWLKDGTRFDSSRDKDRPFMFRLGAGDAMKGWDEGLVGMKVGGKRRLTIPPELGFGKQGAGSVVPPNAVLFYEFELLEVR